MTGPVIRYDLLVQDALRGVVRKVLADAAREGTPGEHHFFVSFRTNAPGVQLSQRMKAKYPEEITIVLQHQFWDLTVNETRFEVNLSFNNIPERLIVPFDAVSGFEDPTGPFGVKFEPRVPTTEAAAPAPTLAAVPLAAVPDATEAAEPAPAKAKTAAKKDKTEKAEKPAARKVEPESAPEPIEDNQQGKVVSIDAFRKKT
ncbi:MULTISPECIES: ClpXP protease specificity-enhancing factor SspB [unclassified Beijerinckia]|uniref:SspB family protein n=1 Tax=unclassified Beijerinckia TaxID=2638183 RepID=UPI00089788E9|nr:MULTISPECIES: ClpXP protease specificity-enhancing factor SspB [unclassified Beijerinckia]MDH7799640.1 hypothetical protein [Beijerinckia sp. GAS462]SEB48421.1 hypothetical protein SAMN05443249_0131 [Beijerinckia sp. 28-YEA-48]